MTILHVRCADESHTSGESKRRKTLEKTHLASNSCKIRLWLNGFLNGIAKASTGLEPGADEAVFGRISPGFRVEEEYAAC